MLSCFKSEGLQRAESCRSQFHFATRCSVANLDLGAADAALSALPIMRPGLSPNVELERQGECREFPNACQDNGWPKLRGRKQAEHAGAQAQTESGMVGHSTGPTRTPISMRQGRLYPSKAGSNSPTVRKSQPMARLHSMFGCS